MFWNKKQIFALVCAVALLASAVPVNTPVSIPNGDMEIAGGWKDIGSGSANTVLAYVNGGHSGKALSATNTAAQTQLELTTERVAVEPGATYVLSFWAKPSSANRFQVFAFGYAAATGGSPVFTYSTPADQVNTVYYAGGGWQQVTLTFTVGETTNYLRPRITNYNTYANGAFLIDDVVLTKVSEQTEGATEAIELIPNSDMSKDSDWALPGGVSATLSYVADGGHDGRALHIACVDPTPDVTTDTYDVTVRPGRIKVLPNTTYTIYWNIKYSSATRYRAQIVEYSNENAAAYHTQAQQLHYHTDWAEASYSFTTGENAAEILPQIQVYQMNSTRDVYLDDVSIQVTASLSEPVLYSQSYDAGLGNEAGVNAASKALDVNGVSGSALSLQFTGTNGSVMCRPNGATSNTIAASAHADYVFRAKVKPSAASAAQLAVLRTGTSQVGKTVTLTAGVWNELEFAFNTDVATAIWPQIVFTPTNAATVDAPVVYMVDDVEIVSAVPYCEDISVYTGHGKTPVREGSVFIGWYSDNTLTTEATSGAAYAKFMTADALGAATLDLNGTAIRNTTNLTAQGLYFRTEFQNANLLKNLDIAEFGVLMLPENLLGADAALTLADTSAARLAATDAADVALLKTGTEKMTCSLSNAVAGERYQRRITARPYALLADGTALYGDQQTSSVAYVASALANMIAAVDGVDSSAVSDLLSIEDTALDYDQTTALVEFCVANYQLLNV